MLKYYYIKKEFKLLIQNFNYIMKKGKKKAKTVSKPKKKKEVKLDINQTIKNTKRIKKLSDDEIEKEEITIAIFFVLVKMKKI